MGWSGSLSASSANGSSITYTPETTEAHGYTSDSFSAPKKGIYQFTLKGSGGHARNAFGNQAAGGEGGLTVGYMLLQSGQSVFVGCGGPCSAAWMANVNPGNAGVNAIDPSNLLFVAGAAGGGGSTWDNGPGPCGVGGNGGGSTGADGGKAGTANVGCGGTQSKGGAGCNHDGDYEYLGKEANPGSYGTGSKGLYTNNDDGNGSGGSGKGGDGGDGYYGGGAGASKGNGSASGGGGGSGYVYASVLTVGTRSYTCSTAQGGGAASNTAGSVTVTYVGPAELPVAFDGTRLTALFFNGNAVDSLVYNGVRVFAQRAMGLLRRAMQLFARKRMVME